MALTPSTMLPLQTEAPDFSLPNRNGEPGTISRSDFAGKPLLVMFICNHCPYVKHLADHVAGLCRDFQSRGLAVVAISSNDVGTHPEDAPDLMTQEAANRGYSFPYLYDADQSVAKAYHAACTPDFFLFDANHKLVYRGQYDDSRPRQTPPQTPTGKDLAEAVEALLNGEPVVEGTQKPSIGCNIKWITGNAPEYFG